MNIGFHYHTIKVLACYSGFTLEDAEIIAYASQYVDDAVEHKPIKILGLQNHFSSKRFNGIEYNPICTAHSGIDFIYYLNQNVQKQVLVSFHFIPRFKKYDKQVFQKSTYKKGKFASEIFHHAVDMVKKNKQDRSLIKLGIASHSYADTWSHHSFSGYWDSNSNDISNFYVFEKGRWQKSFIDSILVNLALDIGHAEVGTIPDQAFQKWKYSKCGNSKYTIKCNYLEFLNAAKSIYMAFCEITGCNNNWSSFSLKLLECFMSKVENLGDYDYIFKKVFPDINFNYDNEKWRREALDGDNFDWINLSPYAYQNLKYNVKDDEKWFHFHEEASLQREFVLENIF